MLQEFDGISRAANPDRRDSYVIGGINYAYNFSAQSQAKAALKAKEAAEAALKAKDASDKLARETAAKEQELADKIAKEKEAADQAIREKEATAKVLRDKEAAAKALKDKELADKAQAEKEAAAQAMKAKEATANTVNNKDTEVTKVGKQTPTESILNITFKTSSTEFTGESLAILTKAAAVLKRNPQYSVSIEGHADARGKDAANLVLSNARAAACVKYLVGKGIAAGRMTSASFGSSRPVAGNDTASDRRKNRRVEFILSL